MESYVALLRAVNVGGTGKLPMAELREMAEAAGFANVRTYIQSGNLLFRTSQSAAIARSALETRLEAYAGRPVGVMIRSGQQMQAVCEANPFPQAAGNQVGVLFLDAAPPEDPEAIARGRLDEDIALGLQEMYIHYPSGMGRSKLRLPGIDATATMRNLNTVQRLAEMARP